MTLNSRSTTALRADLATTAPRAALAALVLRSALAILLLFVGALDASAQSQQVGPSGLPLPRFASTKSAPVNIRMGPTAEHDIAWTFVKAGVPVEITQEFDIWLRIRDSEGQEGWVRKTLLSGKRTALVASWEKKGTTAMRDKPEASARIVAEVDPGVLVEVSECTGRWCRVSANGTRGWLEQNRLWGVYPDEVFR